jgi:alpha-ketoglutarate-dependent taurine dioxygenase
MATANAVLPGPPGGSGPPLPSFDHIGVTPLTGACGAEISGVDLTRPLEPAVLDELMRAFEHFLVILFRDQPLTPEQHKAFSRYIGDLTELPQAPIYPGHPDMQEVRREADEPVSVVPFTRFHTDSPFLAMPPKCMVMRALDVPAYGGDTAFANMYMVYESLSAPMQAFADGLRVVYSGKEIWAKNQALDPDKRLRLRESHGFTEDQLENTHPAVRRHPRTGRKALYVCRAYFKRFVGYNDDESQALLTYFDSLPYRIQYQCRVHWKRDTVIVWDNRFLQHCGVHDYQDERRHLVRTTIRGERPLA